MATEEERERSGSDAFHAVTAEQLEEENPTESPASDSEADAEHERDEARAASSSEPPRPVGKSTEGLTVGGSANQPDAMADGFVHTVYRDGNWVNELEGVAGDRTLPGDHETKEAAVAAGRAGAILRQTEHVIHNQDGSFGVRDSYGSDPRRSES